MARDEAIPAAVLAGVYGFWDLSLELVRKTGDVACWQRCTRPSLRRRSRSPPGLDETALNEPPMTAARIRRRS